MVLPWIYEELPVSSNHITSLQAVDFAFGGLLARCFRSLAPESAPKAIGRFLARPDKEKIYLVKNDDVQAALRRLAQHADDSKGRQGVPDLPLVMYYREQGIVADPNQHVQVAEVTRFVEEETIFARDAAMRLTTIPLALTYSLLFLAWDRPSIEHLALAWWAYVAPLGRRHSRFPVPYMLDGERFEVRASLSAPREILTSNEDMGQDRERLWGSRTMAEVATQAVVGGRVEVPDYFHLIGQWRTM